jgi:putative ABC transport system permease protein
LDFGQSIVEALESLSSNKLRSGLTILGIVIGVAAVVAMLAVGQGAQETITGSISGIGTNLLFVFSGNNQDNVRFAGDPFFHSSGVVLWHLPREPGCQPGAS